MDKITDKEREDFLNIDLCLTCRNSRKQVLEDGRNNVFCKIGGEVHSRKCEGFISNPKRDYVPEFKETEKDKEQLKKNKEKKIKREIIMIRCNVVNCEYMKVGSGICDLNDNGRVDCCPSIRMRDELGLPTFKSEKLS